MSYIYGYCTLKRKNPLNIRPSGFWGGDYRTVSYFWGKTVVILFFINYCSQQYDSPSDRNQINQEMRKRQEEDMIQMQARMALKQSRLSLYSGDMPGTSMLDISRDPLRELAMETAMTQRKLTVIILLFNRTSK